MTLLERFRQKEALLSTICEWGVIVLLILSIVWRGGKSLDMTWLLTGVAAFVTIISHIQTAEKDRTTTPIFLWLAVVGFIALTILSFLFSSTGNYGLDEVLRTASLGLLLLWIIRKMEGGPQKNAFAMRLLRVLALSTIGACIIGILVYTFQPVNRFVGTFFDYRFQTDYWPNAWAEFLLLSWPIVLFLVLKDFRFNEKEARSRIEFLIRCLAIGFVIGCLFLSYSRGAVLVLLMQLVLWAGIVYYKTRPELPIRKAIPIGVLITVIGVVTFLGVNAMRSQVYEVQDVGEKVTFSASEGTSSVSERAQFWGQALNLAAKKPLLGWGPYSFRFVQPALQRHVLATSDHPHNVLLKLLMERGGIATLLFVLVVGLVMYRATVKLLSERTEVESLMFSLKMFIFIGLSGAILHNMIDFNMQFVGIALPFWLLLGVLMTYLDINSLSPISPHIARGTELLIALMMLAVALYEGGYLAVSAMGRHAEAQRDAITAMQWYDKAGGEILTRDLQLSRAKILFEESRLDEAQQAIDSYMARNAEDFRAWKRQGDIYLLSGDRQQALNAYMTAYEKGKYNDLGILRGILEAYQALDQNDAIEAMRPGIDELLTEYADAIQANTHYIALSPNVEEFVSVCNTLSRLFPEEAPRYQVMAAKADHHAQIERSRIESRPPGFLW